MIELIEHFEFRDIQKIRNRKVLPSVKITLQDTYSEGLFFVSNKLKESIKNTDIIASLSTDHSPISFTLRKSQIMAKSKGLWIFNSFLTLNKEFVEKNERTHINLFKSYRKKHSR